MTGHLTTAKTQGSNENTHYDQMALVMKSNLLNLSQNRTQTQVCVWVHRKRFTRARQRQCDKTENHSTKTETTRPFRPISERQWRSSQSDSHRPWPSTAPGGLRFSRPFVRETNRRRPQKLKHRYREPWQGVRGSFRLHMWAASGSISANSSHQWWWLHRLSTKHAGEGEGGGATDCVAIYQPKGWGGGR